MTAPSVGMLVLKYCVSRVASASVCLIHGLLICWAAYILTARSVPIFLAKPTPCLEFIGLLTLSMIRRFGEFIFFRLCKSSKVLWADFMEALSGLLTTMIPRTFGFSFMRVDSINAVSSSYAGITRACSKEFAGTVR
mgnify:CR=1 FL=1